MKTEIKIHEPEVKDFPALYRSKNNGAVVFMTKKNSGFVLFGDGVRDVGYFTNDWSMNQFTKITSDVTITFKAGA